MRHDLYATNLLLHALKGEKVFFDLDGLPIHDHFYFVVFRVTHQLLCGERLECFADILGLGLKPGSQFLEVGFDHELLALNRLVVVDKNAEVYLAHGRMSFEVEVRPVGHAHDLYPAQSIQEDLGVPAVCGIMSHLIRFMLAEAKLIRSHSHRQEELVGSGHVVSESLMGHDALFHSLAKGHLLLFALLLCLPGVELHLDILDL